MTDNDWGERIKADRAARKLGRAKYAEFLGEPFTPSKVYNIEKGREPRDDERAVLESVLSPGDGGTNEPLRTPPETKVEPRETDSEDETRDDKTSTNPPAENEAAPAPAPAPASYEFEHEGYHVSNGMLRTFKRCRRKWYLAYYRRLRRATEDVVGPLAIGTRVHLALSAYYADRDPLEVIDSTYRHDLANVGDDPETVRALESEVDLARTMVEGYLEWLAETGADQGLTVVANEQVVEVPYPMEHPLGPVILTGKLDLRVHREVDDVTLFLDHKTVGSVTQAAKMLHMDEQMLHYHLLELLDGAGRQRTRGGLYNMLRKVKRTDRANPPFYGRVEVWHNDHELQSYWYRVFGELTDMLNLHVALDNGADPRQVAYPNPTRDCTWDCPFYSTALCPMMDDGSAWQEAAQDLYVTGDPFAHYVDPEETP